MESNMERFTFTTNCGDDDIRFVRDSLMEFNRTTSPTDQPTETFNIVVKNEEGVVVGGILTKTYRFAMFVEILWVDENHRKAGLGGKLLQEAERAAMERECRFIHLDTFSFQAPKFYAKNGFEIFGVLEGYPEGVKRYYLKKELGEHSNL